MDVAIAGGHGQVGLRLVRLLSESGHRARGIIRDGAQVADLEAAGGEAIVCDLEQEDPGGQIAGADAVVFAAGAGPGSGPELKRTVDYGAAVVLIEAAAANGVPRYVMLSAIGAADPSAGSEQMRPYLEAKADADRAVSDSGLDHTIVRPGRLTDEIGTGRVEAARSLGRHDEIPREDVAAVLLAVLEDDSTIDLTLDVVGGTTPIAEAIAAL